MFILSSISGGLEFRSVNHTSIYESSEIMDFNSLIVLSNSWPNDVLGTNAYKVLNHVDNHCWQYYNGLIPA